PSWLCLGVPVSAVLGSNREETRENLGNVRAHGVGLAVHGLRGAAEELDVLRALEPATARLNADLVALVNRAASIDAPEVRAVCDFVPHVREFGVRVCVSDVASEDHAQRWHALGCELGGGALFGEPALSFDVPELLHQFQSQD